MCKNNTKVCPKCAKVYQKCVQNLPLWGRGTAAKRWWKRNTAVRILLPPFNLPLSLRGAKRRGNPFPLFLLRNEGNGLPHQCVHWFAMTGSGKRFTYSPKRFILSPLHTKKRLLPKKQPLKISANYSLIAVTTPEPTVRPPSRIAKRRPTSMAMGVISSTFITVLSPGMHISVPSGRVMMPVTSVVRK